MKRILLIAMASGLFMTACEKDKTKAGTFKGKEVEMGHGKAYAWVTLDNESKPVSLGITLTKQALEHLPENPGGPAHEPHADFDLQFPAEAAGTPFKHAHINWNPKGHEPSGIYDTAHFDFHFYTVSSQERNQIPAYDVDSAKFKNVPSAEYLPAMYIYPGSGVPKMGAHWIDITSPELQGAPFRETFIYGTFNGAVIFLETMVEMNFFKAAQFERQVPRPAKVQVSGYYPTRYRIVKDNNNYSIIFDNLEWRAHNQ